MSDTQQQTSQARHGCVFCSASDVVSEALKNCWPEETKEHLRNSRVEFLKAIRSILDARINRMTRQERGTHVTVE